MLLAEWPDDRVTILAAWQATAGERAMALSPFTAGRVIEDLATRARYGEEHRLIAVSELIDEGRLYGRQRRLRELVEPLREAVRSGRLLVIGGWQQGRDGSAEAPVGAARATAGRLAARIMAGQPALMLQGDRYLLVESGQLREAQQAIAPDELQVVPRAQAVDVLSKLANVVGSGNRRQALAEATAHLAPTERPAGDGLLLLRRIPAGWHSSGPAATPVTPSSLRAQGPASPPAKTWIRVQVIEDQTGRPIPDLVLVLTSDSGNEARLTTDAGGLVKLENMDSAVYAVSSPLDATDTAKTTLTFVALAKAPPAPPGTAAEAPPEPLRQPRYQAIAFIDLHRVTDGDTLEKIGSTSGLDASALAKFNWGSDDPDIVAQALRDEVGCSKRTADGKSYELQATDKPGIVFVPRPWKVEGLSCKETHLVRVNTGTRFFLSLENDLGLRIPEAAYKATLANGVEVSGTLGVGGLDAIESPPPGPVIVSYPDQEDIGAKALAARARQSFRDRDPQELYGVLGHAPDTMAAVVAAYDRYFNDHTGQGFVGDVYAEITDPDALAAVEALLARAGIATQESLVVTSLHHNHGSEAG